MIEQMALEVKDPTPQELEAQRREIFGLCERVFANKKDLTYEEYKQIIKHDTSEMFLAVMQSIHSNLPCSAAIFKMKKECLNQPRKTENIAAPK